MTTRKIAILAVSGIATLAITTVASYSLTRNMLFAKADAGDNSEHDTIVPTPTAKPIDNTAYCPLNGKKYTKQDLAMWNSKRPVAVMIENHPESRPQSGLTNADIVYESVAEGGITRFLGVFLCDSAPQWVGPVRSARTYFLDWVSEYDPLYAHVGGANTEGPANALGQIKQYGIRDFDGIIEGTQMAVQQGWQRISDRSVVGAAYEHTMYLDIERLRSYAKDTYNWDAVSNGARWDSTFEKYEFTDQADTYPEASAAASIKYTFWDQYDSMFGVKWSYNATEKTYTREMAGEVHRDKNNDKQIAVSNLIIMLQDQSNADDGYPGNLHLLYKTIGTGEAYIFQNGKMIQGTWNKSGRTAKTKFYDKNKKEIPFARGKIWISNVPTFSKEYIEIK